MKHIIVVGGGAGGLELVTKLAKSLGKKGQAKVTLVDRARTHVWKPLLHEVAAGVINKSSDGIDYSVHAARHKYNFQLGNMCDVDRAEKTITLDPVLDDEGEELIPSRTLGYDYLVIAVGSVSNDFGTPGIKQHCYLLDSLEQAERFHKALLNQLLKLHQTAKSEEKLKVAIVGAGATGTELAAELYRVANLAKHYGMPDMSAKRLSLTIIEAGPRILPALPERIANSARNALHDLNITVREQTRVSEASKEGFITSEGELINADLMVWAAGVKAPDFFKQLDGFELNKAQQVVVNEYLQSTTDDSIFVIGDACGFQQKDGSWVPPRAQSAHQMADTALTNLQNLITLKPLEAYRYTDYGSLVHLSKYSTVGSLMGKLSNSSMFVEGKLARFVYVSLYHMHQYAVHGYLKGSLVLLGRRVGNFVGPKLKLH